MGGGILTLPLRNAPIRSRYREGRSNKLRASKFRKFRTFFQYSTHSARCKVTASKQEHRLLRRVTRVGIKQE